MKNSAKVLAIFTLLGMLAILFSACQKENKQTGTLNLSITDAPIDAYEITGVFITITGIQYNHNGSWKMFEEFEGPQTFNLLDLTHGTSELLGTFPLETGTYTQIRFMLDAPVSGNGPGTNPGCYLVFADESTAPLFVPSGAQTGYKAVGNFSVPANAEVYVTADFDVRKSVVVAGASGKFILKPTIRLVVDNQAGSIKGTVINQEPETETIVYAYEQGTYQESEANEPEPETPRFPNAITSDKVDDEGDFILAFLAEGAYDLVVTSHINGEYHEVLGIIEGVEVTGQQTTNITIDNSLFE